MKDKEGNKVTIKEFFKRWKAGIEAITPKQKLDNEIRATTINIIGYLAGIVILIWSSKDFGLLSYALILIFIGNGWSAIIKWISQRQQLKFFKQLEEDLEDEEVTITKKDKPKKGMSSQAVKVEDLLPKELSDIGDVNEDEEKMKGGNK